MRLVVSNSVVDLQGKDIEILTDSDGNPIAQFFNGNFVTGAPTGNRDKTIIAEVIYEQEAA